MTTCAMYVSNFMSHYITNKYTGCC